MTALLDPFLSSLWEMSLTAAYVTAVVLLLRLLLKKRAPRRVICALWLVVFARLLIPVSLESPVSLVPARLSGTAASDFAPANPAQDGGDAVQGGIQAQPQIPAQNVPNGGAGQTPDAPAAPGPTIIAPASPASPASPAAAAAGAGLENSAAPEPEPPSQAEFPWKALLAGVWLAGALAMGGWGLVSCLRLRRRVRFAVKVTGRVWEDPGVESPFILGMFSPKIYLPTGLEGRARRFILCHEFAHLRRLDHIVKPLCWFALAIHWFNPAVWAAFLLLSRDMEAACDESVVRGLGDEVKADYSYTLLALATAGRFSNPAPCPLAFDEGDAKGRIKNVLDYRRPALWIVTMSVLAVIAAAVCLLTDPVSAKTPDAPPAGSAEPDPSQTPAVSSPAPSSDLDGGQTSALPPAELNARLKPWMLEVLKGERTFYAYDSPDRDIRHLTQVFYGDEPPEGVDVFLLKLAILDLDQDGADELVIWPTGQRGDPYEVIYYTGYLMLRQEGDIIRGYAPGWRSSGHLRANGTFDWSSGAMSNGIGRARFDNGEFSVEDVSWVDNGSYFVEGQSVTEEHFRGYKQFHDALPDPFWYTFENGQLCASISIPLDFSIQWSENIPYFLDENQQMLYRQAYSLYSHIFGANTEEIDAWPGPVEPPHAEPVELNGQIYVPATGLYAYWNDFETAVLSVFTEDFWNAHNRTQRVFNDPQHNDVNYFPIYTNINGRTYYIAAARGSYDYNGNFPEAFQVTEQTDSAISFVMTGHYSEGYLREGESAEERDARLAAGWEYSIDFPMRMVRTEDGWRFDEFHCARTDNGVSPFYDRHIPNPDAPAASSPAPSENFSDPDGGQTSALPPAELNARLEPWMLEVLNGKQTFRRPSPAGNAGEAYTIDQLRPFFYGDQFEQMVVGVEKLAIIDLDGDGANELVIVPNGVKYQVGCAILRQEGEDIAAYAPGWRSFSYVKADGTFGVSSSAFEHGIACVKFTGGEFASEKISWCEPAEPRESGIELYFVDGLPAAAEQFEAAIAAQGAKAEPVWYVFEDGTLKFAPIEDG